MKKYNYTKMSFKEYLQRASYTHSSIATYERFTDQFLQWAENENVEVEQVRYQDILAYMKHCSNNRGYSQRTIQHTMITLTHYFDYLLETGAVANNPVKGIKVKGVKRKTVYHILEPGELNAIYMNFESTTLSQKKNKVIVGMLVYQGLKTEELDKLEVTDVKLTEGKIQVPGSRKSNRRSLQLEPHQVMDLNEYVNQLRPQILEKSNQKTDRLFVSVEGGNKLRLDFLMEQLRKQNPKIENADQLRASVIVKWLKQYNLREVQYLAGHRFISSTEAYQQSDMAGLTVEVNKFHPLG